MKQKMLLVLMLIWGVFAVACGQDVGAAAEQVNANRVVFVSEMPQVVAQPVEVASVQTKPLLKSVNRSQGEAAGMVEGETAVSAPASAVKSVVAEANAVTVAQDGDTVIHTVKEGEWIFELARCYGTPPHDIIGANFYNYYYDYYYYDYYYGYYYYPYYPYHSHNPNYIYPGQQLVIPNVGSNGDPYGPPCVRKHPDTVQHQNGEPGTYIHTVKQGDWIYELARCYGTTPEVIMRANPLYNPNYIYPGELLVIPLAGSTDVVDGPPCVDLYTVKTGDTWASIAAAHDTTEIILMKANPGALDVGRRIWVPVH